MNRRDSDRYDQDNYRNDFSGGAGYDRSDAHYHSARNLTNEFERHYQHSGGSWGNDREQEYGQGRHRPHRSYHEGNTMGDTYERLQESRGAVRSDTSYDRIYGERDDDRTGRYDRDQDRYRGNTGNYSSNRGSYGNYMGSGQSDRGRSGGMGSYRDIYSSKSQGDIRRGYGISNYEGTSDRYNTLNSDQNRGGDYYGGSGMGRGGSRFGGGSGMGESFPSSNRGVPDTTYGHRNFSDREGTGMGSTYGGQNYGGGPGYSGGNRGGSFGNSSYGTSSGNYGGYGSMGEGTYGGRGSSGRGSSSHNTDRGTNELGGF